MLICFSPDILITIFPRLARSLFISVSFILEERSNIYNRRDIRVSRQSIPMYLNFQSCLNIGSLFTMVLTFFGRERDVASHTPTLPPSYPLAVRSPYLSTWMPSDQVQTLPYAEPQFWAGQSLTWSVMARVDGQAYSLMSIKNPGDNIRPAIVRHAEYTATHSVFTLSAGKVTFTLDFFSPISPSNYLRQSLPFSKMSASTIESIG